MKCNIISIFKTNNVLLALSAAVWLSGCTRADDHALAPKDDARDVNFSLTVPNIGIPKESASRTMAGTGLSSKEDEVSTVDILVFDNTSNTFLEWVVATNVSQNLASSTSANFSVQLTETTSPTCIAVVANKSLSAIASVFVKGVTTKKAVMEALTHTSTVNWPANGGGAYTPIPMYGETVVDKIYRGMTIGDVDLTRMLARIDIKTTASNFAVEEVYLVNYNTTGYVAPQWNTNGLLTNADATNIPSSSGKKTGESNKLTYVVGGSTNYEGEIYTFEAPAAADGANDAAASRKDAACIIVKGKISGGASTYYRVDFMATGSMNYIALKRNYKYIIDIQQANGVGYPTIGEAIASYRTMTALNVRVITYGSEEKITSVVYNGQYMLGVGEPEVKLSQYERTNYPVSIYTDTPGGWTATTPNDSWLTFNGGSHTATGAANVDNNIALKISYFDGDVGTSRTATATITAGRLTHAVTVTQTVREPGEIRFMDAYGNLLENGLFFPMKEDPIILNGSVDPPPQVVYVMWTTDRVKVSRRDVHGISHPDALVQHNALYTPYIKPNDEGDGFTYLDKGVQAITVSPKNGEATNVYWRWDKLLFDLVDEADLSVGTHEFPINQGHLEFKIANFPNVTNRSTYELELGPIHTLELHSNVNWEITNVEQIGATELLDESDDVLKAGTSNMVKTVNTPDVKKRIDVYNHWNVAHGTDVVAGMGIFHLRVPTGDWVSGKQGTVRVTFKNLMHTGGIDGIQNDFQKYKKGTSDDDYFPFYKTIDLVLKAPVELGLKYTTALGDSRFLASRERYTNADNTSAYFPYYEATQKCVERGKNWRMPTMSEALLSSVYVENLGGLDVNQPLGWHAADYWTTTTIPDGTQTYSVNIGWNGGARARSAEEMGTWTATVRCVATQTPSGTKYPYVQAYGSGSEAGAMIVSRDATGGVVNSSNIFLSNDNEITETTNKIAPKLLVANEDVDIGDQKYASAVTACTGKGTGWRLPTRREALLMMSVGMTRDDYTLTNAGFNTYTLPSGFKKLISDNSNDYRPYWTRTQANASGTMYVLLGYGITTSLKTDQGWGKARCVKSIF